MIYFMQAGDNGPIKIGYSKNPRRRLIKVQSDCPHKVNLIGVVHGDISDEKALQAKFKEHKLRGEWYEPNGEIIHYLRNEADLVPLSERLGRKMDIQIVDMHTYLAANGIKAVDMAGKLGITPGRLSQLRNKPWPAELALKAEQVTAGAVDAATLSPFVAQARGVVA